MHRPVEQQQLFYGEPTLVVLTGGNPALEPERARVRSLGVAFGPPSRPGLAVSADWHTLEVDNAIGAPDLAPRFVGCPGPYRQTVPRVREDYIQCRTDVDLRLGNDNRIQTSTLELAARYAFALPVGALSARAAAVHLLGFLRDDAFARAELGGAAGPQSHPDLEISASAEWTYADLRAGASVRAVRGLTECSNAALGCGTDTSEKREVAPYLWFGLFAGRTWRSALGATTLAAGIGNLTNRAPPRVYAGAYANSDATLYDYAGRSLFVRITQALAE